MCKVAFMIPVLGYQYPYATQGMIDDPIGVQQFCRRYVEPMGEESDHIHIVAITDALQVE